MGPELLFDLDRREGQLAVAAVSGELDVSTASVLYRQANEALARHRDLIMDLAGVDFCDSSGFNALLRLRRRALETGGRLIVAAPPPQVAQLLALTGSEVVFAVHTDVDEAQAVHADPRGDGTAP